MDLLAIVRRGYDEAWNQGRLEVLDELLSPDFVAHDPTAPTGEVQRDAVRDLLQQLRSAFPDLHREACDAVAQGDKIAVRWEVTGTHRGPFAGLPPTGRRVRTTGLTLYRIADGQIAEEWVEFDSAGLMRQLGQG